MRAESLGLRSWWLLGGLLWALAVWAATLAGLGGAIAPLTAADNEAAALPALPATTTADTDAGAQYPEIAARPLFAEDRRPHPFVLGRDPAGAAGSARLTGVLITPGLEMATLTTDQGQSLRLRLGAEPESGWQLLALQPRSATVNGPHGTQTLELAVFDGNGGQAPTALLNVGPGDRPPSAAMPTPAPAVVPSPPAPPPPAAEINTPSAEQIQSLRERIQARRRLLQQNPNGQSPDQSK